MGILHNFSDSTNNINSILGKRKVNKEKLIDYKLPSQEETPKGVSFFG